MPPFLYYSLIFLLDFLFSIKFFNFINHLKKFYINKIYFTLQYNIFKMSENNNNSSRDLARASSQEPSIQKR